MSQQHRPAGRLAVTTLEDRAVPASPGSLTVTDDAGFHAVGSRSGDGTAALYAEDGTLQFEVSPFGDDFDGAVRVALADVTGDGTSDLIAAAGSGGGSAVAVYDGSSQELVGSFTAYEESFTGGVYVAAADLTGDGVAEIVTGADEGGGPRVRVFDGSTVAGDAEPTVVADFLAIDDANFRGGVRLALGDVTGDGVADLVVGAGFGGGPRVAAYDGQALADGQVVALFPDFFAYEPGLRNGVFPAVGDLNADGCGDIVLGAGPGGGPRVRALDGKGALRGEQSEIANYFAGDESNRSGVEVGVATASDGTVSIVGTDLATDAADVFTSDAGVPGGGRRGERGPGRGGQGRFGGGEAFTGTTYTLADADALSAAVVGTYAGTGSGTLITLDGVGEDLTSADSDITVTLTITSAEPVLFDDADGADGTTPLRALTLTGTVTVTTDAGTLELAVAGTLRLRTPRGSGGDGETDLSTAQGTLILVTDRTVDGAPAEGNGVSLIGSLADGELTAARFVASDRTVDPGTIFQSPSSRDADRLVLTLG